MATASIVYSNIETQSQDNILGYVDNRTYVKDPRSPSSTTKNRQFVYESDPFHKAINFGDFPYIVIFFPMNESIEPTADGKSRRVIWSHRVLVRAARDGSVNTRTDQGRTDMLSIGDDLVELFNNMTVKKELQVLNIYDITIKKTNSDNFAIKEKEIYEAEYELSYWSRLTTSA